LNSVNRENFATVTFAVYDDAPIACQGDDDRKKIQVIREKFGAGHNIAADALKRSAELGLLHNLFVQVWDIQADDVQ
jgi:hypothetical protein